MPKLTSQERADLEARLRDDDDDDETDEVEVGQGDGKYFRGSYRRAKQLGYVTEPQPKADPKPDKEPAETGEAKRFTSGRRTG